MREPIDTDRRRRRLLALLRIQCSQTAHEAPAVHILALLHHPKRPVSTILIEQFRPPIGRKVIELPAGLIDNGEKPACVTPYPDVKSR